MSLPLPEDNEGPTQDDIVLSNAYGNALYVNTSNCEAKSVLSRSTTRTSYHHMPSATFFDEVGIILGTERPRGPLIPETDEEAHMELVQRVRMDKLKSPYVGLPMTNDEQRHDKILARFAARNDTIGNQGMAQSPSTAEENGPEQVTPLPVSGQEENHAFLVPHKQDPNFVGRNTELEDACKHICATEDPWTLPLAVSGPSGIGKTAFVTEFVYQIHDDDPSCVCIWVFLSTTERLYNSYIMAANALNIPSPAKSELNLIAQIHSTLLELQGRRWVLILDDIIHDNLHLSSAWNYFFDSVNFHPLLDCNNGSIITISQGRMSVPVFHNARPVELTPLGSAEALQLLQSHFQDHDLISSRTDAASILSSIGHSPLAIVLAVAYINRHTLSLGQYQALLADHAQHIDDLHIHKGVRHVAGVVFVSLTTICQSNDAATDCLLALACTSGCAIRREHLFIDESQDTSDAIATLEAYGLITIRSCNSVIDTVRPLCLTMRLWLSNFGLVEEWAGAVIAVLLRILPTEALENDPVSKENTALWRRLLQHLNFALDNMPVSRQIAAKNGMAWNELQDTWIFGLRNYAGGDNTDAN